MGKGASKRRLKDAEPIPGAKKRKATTAERVVTFDEAYGQGYSDEIMLEDELAAPAQTATKKSTKKSKSHRQHLVQTDNEAEDEHDHAEEENYMELVTMLERMRTKRTNESIDYINKFENSVGASQQSLKLKLQSLDKDWKKEDLEFVNSFQKAFEAAIGTSTQGPPKADPVMSDFASNDDQCKKLLTTADRIIAIFEKLDNDASGEIMGHEFADGWKDEDKLMKTVIDGGQEFTRHKTNSILTASCMAAMEPKTTQAAQVLCPDRNANPAKWGKLGKKQVKIYKKLDKLNNSTA